MLETKYSKVSSVVEGVRRLLTIRDAEIPELSLEKKPSGEHVDIVVIDGKRIPMLSWRYEPRMNALRNYGQKAVAENCCLNASSFVGKDVDQTGKNGSYDTLKLTMFSADVLPHLAAEVVPQLMSDVETLKAEPGKRWKFVIEKAIYFVVAAVVGYFLARVGLG